MCDGAAERQGRDCFLQNPHRAQSQKLAPFGCNRATRARINLEGASFEVGCAAFDVQFCVAQVVQNYRISVRPLIDPGNVSKKLFPSASINFLMRLVITGSQCT